MTDGKTYRTEDFNVHEPLNNLIDVLSGYPEMDLAKETLEVVLENQREIIELQQVSSEVQVEAMKLYRELIESFSEEEELIKRERRGRLTGFGSEDPLEVITDRAFEATRKMMEQITDNEEAVELMLEGTGDLTKELGKRVNKLMDRPEIAKKDKKKLEAVKNNLIKHANQEQGSQTKKGGGKGGS